MSKVPEFEKVKCETPDLAKQNLEKLKALFPGVVTEGPDGVAIDVEALKQECSATPIEGNVERYEFTWPGKRAAKAAASTATNKTLRPCRAESVNFDTTENLYIEGDNLEVLKLLQTNYAGKVKMIYIDPPYNTGHDFVYRDRFSLTQKELESDAGAFDDDGNRFEVNDSSEARYHSNWCSMMYPRLKIARNLLMDNGVIFVSIDDNEITNARRILDEIFGEGNFVAQIVWKRKRGRDNSARWFSKAHEYALLYAKKIEEFEVNYLELDDETKKAYKNPDNDPRGPHRDLACWARGTQGGVKYAFKAKDGTEFSERLWLFSKENLEKMDADNRLIFHGDNIYRKLFINENAGKIPETLWDDTSNAANASDEIKALFGEIVFDTPKPIPYIQRMIKIASSTDSLVLDFFSGSCTTAHALFRINAEDGGQRKFIMVQLPERCVDGSVAAKANFNTICDVAKERIRRAGKKIAEENATTAPNIDIGFRVLKLDSSSLEDASETASGTQQQMLGLSRIKGDRTSEDLLFQTLLESKLSLSDRIEKKKIEGNEVFFVSDTALVACLDAKAKMTEKFFTALAKFQPALAFFRDDLFESDSARINLAQIFKQFSPNTTISVV